MYDGTLPVAELNASGNVTVLNTFGANGLISSGSTERAWDPSGNLATYLAPNSIYPEEFGTDAWGNPWDPDANPYGFSGQFGAYDDGNATGLVLMGFRYYDPQTGRFLTKDPIGYAGGLNLYAYTGNNPVNYADPLGLDWFDATETFSNWFFERTPGEFNDAQSSATNSLRHSLAGDAMRAEFLRNGGKSGVYEYGTLQAFGDSLRHGFTNGTQFQVGGFRYLAANNGNGTVTFTIKNELTLDSFDLHAYSITGKVLKFFGVPDRYAFALNRFIGRKKQGERYPLMGKYDQWFQWTEKIPCATP